MIDELKQEKNKLDSMEWHSYDPWKCPNTYTHTIQQYIHIYNQYITSQSYLQCYSCIALTYAYIRYEWHFYHLYICLTDVCGGY